MNQDPQVYFISGVCGTGKSSTRTHLKEILPTASFDVRDFDERGVPDGGGPAWHDKETEHWLDVAAENAKRGVSTIVCGFAEPERFKKVHKKEKHPQATLFLLHASSDTIRKRLLGRYPTLESVKEINRASGVPLNEFVENMISFAPQLRTIFEKEGMPIIETDTKTSREVAQEIAGAILHRTA